MLNILGLCAILAFVNSEEQTQEDDTVEVAPLENYAAVLSQFVYDNECAPASSSSSSAPAPSPDDNKYEDADKFEKQYDGEDEYAGNEVVNDDGSGSNNSEQQETSTFCKCLAAEKASGKSYAASQNDFSKCIDKANGNDAKHWERVAKKYEQKYGGKTGWGKIQITTTKAIEQQGEAVPADNSDNTDNTDNADQAAADDNTDNTDKTDEDIPAPNATSDDATALLSLDEPDNRFGNAAIYITFIGASIMLFICAWFIKDGMKKWKLREYSTVDQSSCFESEADADRNGNPYGGGGVGDDDWDDNYDSNYSRNEQNNKGKKGKFSQWNQYSAV